MGLHLLAEPDAPRPQDEVRRSVDQPDKRPEEEHEQLERAAYPERGPLRPLDREVLGRLLPEDQVRVGYDREPERHRDDAYDPLAGYPEVPEERGDQVRDRRLADPAKTEGGHGDADLADGEVAVEIPQRVVHHPCPRA